MFWNVTVSKTHKQKLRTRPVKASDCTWASSPCYNLSPSQAPPPASLSPSSPPAAPPPPSAQPHRPSPAARGPSVEDTDLQSEILRFRQQNLREWVGSGVSEQLGTSVSRCRACLSWAQRARPSLRARLQSASCRVSWATCRRAWCSSEWTWSLWVTMELMLLFRASTARSLLLRRSRRLRISFRVASPSACPKYIYIYVSDTGHVLKINNTMAYFNDPVFFLTFFTFHNKLSKKFVYCCFLPDEVKCLFLFLFLRSLLNRSTDNWK